MPEFKGAKEKYVFVQGMATIAVLMIVTGLVMFMGNYFPGENEAFIWYGVLLLILCLPVSLIFGLIYTIKSRTGGQKLVTRVETCKWKNRNVSIVVEKVPESPQLHDTFVYVDNELVSRTYAKKDGETETVEGSFVHGVKKVPIKIRQMKGTYVMSEYFAPQGSSYPAPTVYFEVNIDGEVLAAGNPGMSRKNIYYWAFVCFLVSLLFFFMILFPAKQDPSMINEFSPDRGLYVLLSVAVLLCIAAWDRKKKGKRL
jgi:hypothetical protein